MNQAVDRMAERLEEALDLLILNDVARHNVIVVEVQALLSKRTPQQDVAKPFALHGVGHSPPCRPSRLANCPGQTLGVEQTHDQDIFVFEHQNAPKLTVNLSTVNRQA